MAVLGSLKRFYSKETALVLLQLCLWSELGVLTRIYVDRLFNDGCDDGWGLCLTSDRTSAKQYGAQFFDLPANMLGCFVMGLLSTSNVLGLKTKKNLAIMPSSHGFQGDKELQLGLRTGYCGSLTTFASWELSLLQLLIGSKGGNGGQWQQWLWGWIIGFELAYASLLLGEHAALAIHRWILPEGSKEPESEVTEMERPTEAAEEEEDLYGGDELTEVATGNGEGHRSDTHENIQDRNTDGRVEMTDLERPTEAAEEGEDVYGTADSHQVLTAGRTSQQSGHTQARSDLEGGVHPRHRLQAKQPHRQTSKSSRKPKPSKQPGLAARLPLTTICCAVMCILMTVLWIVLAIVDSEEKHAGRRQQWFALLFAPFGCILRWVLSDLNVKQNRPLPWFPVGTFAANMIACCIDFIIGGLTNRYSLGYWPTVILPAIRVGYAGSLSTVSTFIAEVRAELQGWPEKVHGYLYPFITIAAGIVLGIVLYGWSVWRVI